MVDQTFIRKVGSQKFYEVFFTLLQYEILTLVVSAHVIGLIALDNLTWRTKGVESNKVLR